MKLRTQVFLLTATPLVGLLLLSGKLLFAQVSSYRGAIDTQENVENVKAISAVVHMLQIERGQSAGFIASAGQNFGGTLPAARLATDEAVARLPAGASELIADLAGISDIRAQVDAGDSTVSAVAGVYTGRIQTAMGLASGMLLSTQSAPVTKLGAGLIALSSAKEAAGLQRAAGATGLSSGTFNLEVYQAFVARGAAERWLLATAKQELEGEVNGLDLETVLGTSGAAAARELIVSAGPETPISDLSGSQWFAQSTEWIDALRENELRVLDVVRSTANTQANQATLLLGMTIALAVCTVLIVLLMGGYVLRNFTRNLVGLTNALERLGRREIDDRVRKVDTSTEFGALFFALDQTKAHIRAADEEMAQASAEREQVIDRLENALAELAGGDVSRQLDLPFPPEYEDLRESYNGAITKLGATMVTVHGAVDVVQNTGMELTTSAENLSRRTESQAAALEETTAALTQLAEQVDISAKSAIGADEIAVRLKTEAVDGKNTVEDAVSAMREIAASSEEMTRTIGLIEEIAFQTNLLAVNAGVEAARAGESGRGFAVVAQEVRSLAVRATGATNEIKNMIEESNRKVTSGVQLVENAGLAFLTITTGVEESSEAIGAIASEASAQAVSISEIRAAMTELDQVTQQNASMVSNGIDLSVELGAQAGRLRHSVDIFTLPTEHNALVAA